MSEILLINARFWYPRYCQSFLFAFYHPSAEAKATVTDTSECFDLSLNESFRSIILLINARFWYSRYGQSFLIAFYNPSSEGKTTVAWYIEVFRVICMSHSGAEICWFWNPKYCQSLSRFISLWYHQNEFFVEQIANTTFVSCCCFYRQLLNWTHPSCLHLNFVLS